jgi:hypothetical protein
MNTQPISHGNTMKISTFSLTVILVALIGAIFFYLTYGRTVQNDSQANIAPESSAPIAESQPPAQSNAGENIEPANLPPINEPRFSKADLESVKKWEESRGYFSATDYQIYESYGPETIRSLASNGDIKAIYALAKLQALDGADKNQIISTYLEAATLGSTQALILASGIARTKRHFVQFDGPDGDTLFKKEMLESLSLSHVALMRGDKAALGKINETKVNLNLTQDDEIYIEKRSREIYNELEAKRLALGLGPFDNSIPEVVDAYLDAESKGFK